MPLVTMSMIQPRGVWVNDPVTLRESQSITRSNPCQPPSSPCAMTKQAVFVHTLSVINKNAAEQKNKEPSSVNFLEKGNTEMKQLRSQPGLAVVSL